MIIVKNLISIFKIIFITFFFILIIDFFFGKKIMNKFDSFFLKSQFGEKLIRIDHPVYHHTLRENVVYSSNVSFIGTYELCTNNFGFKSKMIPALEVFASTGMKCAYKVEKKYAKKSNNKKMSVRRI